MNLLNAKNISHKFDTQLFSDISLELKQKESIAIIGSSGSGKSTLLHILSTMLKPDSGSVFIDGEDVAKMSKKKLIALKRDMLGIVFQAHYLFRGFSAYENLEVATLLSNQTIDVKLLKLLNIEQNIDQKVTNLSGGQQQRVSIARVLSKKPKILFLDEPTGNLDKTTANEVMDIFFKYIDEHSAGMFLVTHDESIAYRCDRVFALKDRELKRLK
ncbi:MAG: ABC transporter ATP-binding protein [Sulfurimonas sp.]|jgi:putative ABC transport system ATP-binding protein|nr:ABC transporter ATP-binding protein [Sulfurimonadaceae bacterium]